MKLVLDMQDVKHLALNASGTAQTVGRITQCVGNTTHNVSCNTLVKDQRGGLRMGPPTPVHEKTLMFRNDF